MHRNIRLMNYYTEELFCDRAGRHYWFARRLKEEGIVQQYVT
jgi:hypothetical protein